MSILTPVIVKNRLGETINPAIDNGFMIPPYDRIELSYTAGDLTKVEYYLVAVIVATLNLTYASGNLSTITKT